MIQQNTLQDPDREHCRLNYLVVSREYRHASLQYTLQSSVSNPFFAQLEEAFARGLRHALATGEPEPHRAQAAQRGVGSPWQNSEQHGLQIGDSENDRFVE